MGIRFQQKRDTAANWTSNNPTLLSGEIGFETDTNKFKIGDGSTAWTSLAYVSTYIDRGDPNAWDFTLGNLTTDGTWRDLDLSGIVAAGGANRLVKISVEITDDAVGYTFAFRQNGRTNAYAQAGRKTQVANQSFQATLDVLCDANRKIEYYASNTTWTSINLVVRGWWV